MSLAGRDRDGIRLRPRSRIVPGGEEVAGQPLQINRDITPVSRIPGVFRADEQAENLRGNTICKAKVTVGARSIRARHGSTSVRSSISGKPSIDPSVRSTSSLKSFFNIRSISFCQAFFFSNQGYCAI